MVHCIFAAAMAEALRTSHWTYSLMAWLVGRFFVRSNSAFHPVMQTRRKCDAGGGAKSADGRDGGAEQD